MRNRSYLVSVVFASYSAVHCSNLMCVFFYTRVRDVVKLGKRSGKKVFTADYLLYLLSINEDSAYAVWCAGAPLSSNLK